MEGQLISSHKMLTDYSRNAKIKRVVVRWVVFILIYVIFQLTAVQNALIDFANSVDVNWVTNLVDFLTNGLWIFIILLIGNTLYEIFSKQKFHVLNIYDNGVGFLDNDNEKFETYEKIYLSYGKHQETFNVQAKNINLKAYHSWKEFEQPELLKSNLERYGIWNKIPS